MPPAQASSIENQLLIEPLFTPVKFFPRFFCWVSRRIFHRKRKVLPVQGELFECFLEITNIGETVFEGALIKNIQLLSGLPMNFYDGINGEFLIPSLNPHSKTTLPLKNIQTDLAQQVWMNFEIVPRPGAHIITYQLGAGGQNEKFVTPNMWGRSFVVSPKFEQSQKHTNYLIALLTLLIFLDGVFGLKEVVLFILNSIQSFFEVLVHLLSYLTGH